MRVVVYGQRAMVSLPKPEVILTHESDLDGLLAGLLCRRLARRLFDVDVPLQAYHNHNWRQRALTEASAWICDLTFEARLDKPNWLIIDHHATDIQPKQARLIHDLDKSAGLLCYELCQREGLGSPALDRLVHLNNALPGRQVSGEWIDSPLRCLSQQPESLKAASKCVRV